MASSFNFIEIEEEMSVENNSKQLSPKFFHFPILNSVYKRKSDEIMKFIFCYTCKKVAIKSKKKIFYKKNQFVYPNKDI